MNATEQLIKALETDAPTIYENDRDALDKLAEQALAENDLHPRIGQPLPLADAIFDVICTHSAAWDDIETSEWGSGMYLVARAIVCWDEQGFREVELFHSQESAAAKFEQYRVFYRGEEE